MGIEDKYDLDLDDPETKRRLEETFKRVQEELRPLTDPIRASSQLTAADYAITINSPPLDLPADYDFSQLFKDY